MARSPSPLGNRTSPAATILVVGAGSEFDDQPRAAGPRHIREVLEPRRRWPRGGEEPSLPILGI
jgi:hypothetical protein